MKLFRPWVMAVVVALAACGDGLRSPDFVPVVTFESVAVEPAVVGQGSQIPAGTSLGFRAKATYTTTVPPGSVDEFGNPQSEKVVVEDVTSVAEWTSENASVASVSAGVVNGLVASQTPVTITATHGGKSGTTDVVVTSAELESVEYVKPAGFPRAANNTYTIAVDATANFEIYGRFSDNQTRLITGSNYVVAWTSSDQAVVSNEPAGNQTFRGVAIGTAGVTGEVTTPSSGVTPDSATATVNVRQLSELCLAEFLAPEAVARPGPASAGCIPCSADATENMIDGDETTSASLSIPLGLLLQSSVSAEVLDLNTVRLVPGAQVGFVVSKPADLLAASLLQDVTIETLNCTPVVDGEPTCEVVQSFSGRDTSAPLYVSLLGLVGGEPAALVQTDPIETAANGMRIAFSGGLLSVLAALNVNAACAATAAPAP